MHPPHHAAHLLHHLLHLVYHRSLLYVLIVFLAPGPRGLFLGGWRDARVMLALHKK